MGELGRLLWTQSGPCVTAFLEKGQRWTTPDTLSTQSGAREPGPVLGTTPGKVAQDICEGLILCLWQQGAEGQGQDGREEAEKDR